MNNVFQRLRKSQSGFTLIELLVVVAIIGLLAAFAMPRLFEAINKARQAPGDADLKTISSGLERFYLENADAPGTYPTGPAADVMADLRGRYLKMDTTFINGFNRGYIYVTDTGGTGYILVDPGKIATAIHIDCNGTLPMDFSVTATAGAFTAPTVAAVTPAYLANLGQCRAYQTADSIAANNLLEGVRIVTH